MFYSLEQLLNYVLKVYSVTLLFIITLNIKYIVLRSIFDIFSVISTLVIIVHSSKLHNIASNQTDPYNFNDYCKIQGINTNYYYPISYQTTLNITYFSYVYHFLILFIFVFDLAYNCY